jgi:hypothetical protein
MLADCPGLHKPDKVIRQWFNRLKRDLHGTMAAAAALSKELRDSVHVTESGYVKTSLHKKFGRWPIFREYKKWFDTDDDTLWQYLLTFLEWGRKAEYINPLLEQESFQKWKAIENDLCRVDPPLNLLEDLKFILSFLPDPDYEFLSLKFGQKKVSEPDVKLYSDKLSLRYHRCVEDLLDHISSDAPGLDLIIPDPELWALGRDDRQHASIDYSTQMFVPKDRWSVRGIAKEPNTVMLSQQGVMNMLLHSIDQSPFSHNIHIDDQSRNASLALRSSLDGKYDTIDMKDASDRASNRVVKFVFPTKWNEALQVTRTARTKLPNGRIVRVEKFAPMGSALCFPVQTLLFTAVCALARIIVSNGVTAEQYLKSGAWIVDKLQIDRETAVYGDDIICPRSDTLVVISLLEALGFVVNRSKSYLHPNAFRESCGTWALRGTLVTPIVFKVKGLAAQNLEYVYGLVDLCNRLFVAGYYSVHAFLAGYIPRQFYVEVPYEGHLPLEPHSLLSDDPDNTPLRKQRLAGVAPGWTEAPTNLTLQRNEYRIKVYRTGIDVVSGESHERYQYARFLQSPSTTEGAKPPKGDSAQPEVRGVWVAAY